MARIRTIKPEFWTNEELSSINAESALLAIALLNYADDEGYFRAHPGLVRAGCMPLRDTSMRVSDMLASLTDISYIRVGTGSDGKRYGQIVNFSKHQVINRSTRSQISSISITWDSISEHSLSPHGSLTDVSLLEKERELEREKEMEQGRETHTVHRVDETETRTATDAPTSGRGKRDRVCGSNAAIGLESQRTDDDEFEIFWAQHPRRDGSDSKRMARRAWSARVRDGTSPGEMIAGTMAYAQHCDRKRITGTSFVMQGATFLGPDMHFRNDWRKPNGTGNCIDDEPF